MKERDFIRRRFLIRQDRKTLRRLSGRGIFLMSHLADKIKFNKKGNTVTMTFKNIIT